MTVTDVDVAGSQADDLEDLKTCKTCGENKPHDDFYAQPNNSDGLQSECKICLNNRRKARYAERHKLTDVEVSQLNRAEKFVKGYLETKELTDYELETRQIEVEVGTGRYIPFKDLDSRTTGSSGNRFAAKLNKELSLRLNEYIKSKSMRAIQVIFEIADSELVEPSDRLKAATWLSERVIGKTPEVLLTGDAGKVYEDIFDTSVQSGSRENYRNRIESGFNQAQLEIESGDKDDGRDSNTGQSDIIDAEVEGETSELGDFRSNGESGHERTVSEESAEFINQAGNGEDTGLSVIGEGRSEFRNEKERLRKARAKAKQRRFAARAVGATSLDKLPYLLEFSLIKTGSLAGKLRCRMVCPSDLTENRLAKLEATNALTDEALKILYPQVEGENDGDEPHSQPIDGRSSSENAENV